MRRPDTLTLDPRENGPRGFANGGFGSGALAGLVGGTATVTLRAPLPVGVPLDVRWTDDGADLMAGSAHLASAVTTEPFVLAPPYVPTMAEAEQARRVHPFRGLRTPLSDCVVCGAERMDGLRVSFGPIPGRPQLVASPFAPTASWAVDGVVRPAAVWGALDCPSYPVEAVRRARMALLGQLTAHRRREVLVGEELIAVGWTESIGNRSLRTASALVDAAGEVVASARAVWIQVERVPDALAAG